MPDREGREGQGGIAEISDCLFEDNVVTGSGSEGGAVWLGTRTGGQCTAFPSSTYITDTDFRDNRAKEGGAIWGEFVEVHIENSDFYRNYAEGPGSDGIIDARGGAVWLKMK